MGTFDLKGYRKELERKAKALRKSKSKSELQTSKYMVVNAKKLAPRSSGETIKGIRSRKRKKGMVVESWVPGQFKQNLWANQTQPFRTPKVWWNQYQPTLYGQGGRSTRGGKIVPVNWTGSPRFWSIALGLTTKRFRKIARINTLKALRGTI